MTHSPLTDRIQTTTDASSRGGTKVDRFIVHHAATTSLAALLADFAPGGREVSANYALKDDTLVCTVDEDLRAWTSAAPEWDGRAVTIEVCNSEAGGSWPVSELTFDTLAQLIADVADRYGFPITDETVLTHQELWTRYRASYPTACPGDLQRRKAELLDRARAYQTNPSTPTQQEDEVNQQDKDWMLSTFVTKEDARREERYRLYYCATPPANLPNFIAIDWDGGRVMYANDGETQARHWRDVYHVTSDTVEQAKAPGAALTPQVLSTLIDIALGKDSAFTNKLASH